MLSRRPFDAGIEAQKCREEEGEVKSDGLREVNLVLVCISAEFLSRAPSIARLPAWVTAC